MKSPPLAQQIPENKLLGHALHIRKDVLGFALRAQEHFPEICQSRLGPMKVHLVFHPDLVQDVLQRKSASFNKDTFITTSLKTVLGNGLLTNDGPSWHKQRKMSQPVFHFQRMRESEQMIREKISETIAQWKGPLNLSEALMKMTLRIISQMTLGEDLGVYAEEVDRDFPFLVNTVYKRAVGVVNFPLLLPTPANLKFRRIIRGLDQIILGLIEKRKKEDLSKRDDLLSRLLLIRDEESGSGLSPTQIRDEVMTIFLAGHETTANSLMWFFYLMAQHPDWESRIIEESRSGATEPVILRAVMSEVMRLYPAGWSVVRRAGENVQIGNYEIAQGDLLTVFSYATHRHPAFWKNAEQFDPSRFLDEGEGVKNHKFAYFPFGGGPRICIGKHLALFMMERIVSQILPEKRLLLETQKPVEAHPVTTLGMKESLFVRVEKR
jgi:cytochrome P450